MTTELLPPPVRGVGAPLGKRQVSRKVLSFARTLAEGGTGQQAFQRAGYKTATQGLKYAEQVLRDPHLEPLTRIFRRGLHIGLDDRGLKMLAELYVRTYGTVGPGIPREVCLFLGKLQRHLELLGVLFECDLSVDEVAQRCLEDLATS